MCAGCPVRLRGGLLTVGLWLQLGESGPLECVLGQPEVRIEMRMASLLVAISIALFAAGCARMPSKLVSVEGSALRFSSNTEFYYDRADRPTVECRRQSETSAEWNRLTHAGIASCADGTVAQFERMTGMYYNWFQVRFDGKEFAEPGREFFRSSVYGTEVPVR